MKTKKLSFAMLLVVAVAMSAFGQTSKREVVFTMNANEVIYQNEYALFQTFNRNRFACITLDTITDKYTFVFNGERIKTASSCGNQWDDEWHLYYINPGEAKGYIFAYRENGRWYINYRGVVDGGFDDVTLFSSDYEGERYTPEKNYDYLYKLAGRWYVSKNGKNRKISLIERTGEYGKYYVNVNGSTVGGPYGSFVDYLTLTESGKYAYCYWDNGYYVNVNGSTVAGPYESIYGLTLTESGKYAYSYRDNGKHYVNVNGSTVGGP
ncbi:MAG: hypothetical protein LBF17_02805 [Mediterranea sp.]|jgi:hypothetical protein|nr:hypothetical protein [Mediterranea sp.]